MINPHLTTTWYLKRADRARGTKTYHAGFDLPAGAARVSRKRHKTATEAIDYGKRVKVRWIRLYNAAVLLAVTEPVQA